MMEASHKKKNILWWGRFDPGYSRNRILRQIMVECGFTLHDFRPRSSFTGSLEAQFSNLESADAVWVGCFRHRDFHSARKFADKKNIPLIFDPLISSWDKVVFERKKFPASSWRARRFLHWEKSLYSSADIIIADTEAHSDFFQSSLASPKNHTFVIPVGAEESLFTPQKMDRSGSPPEILFFGSFISLQAPQVIVEAARMVSQVRWTLLGDGPMREQCEKKSSDLTNMHFENWLPYEELPERIGRADVVLGVFGDSPKASRVIPNKVYQALACARPVISRSSEAYPKEMYDEFSGAVAFVPPADPMALARAAANLVAEPEKLPNKGIQARLCYQRFFSKTTIRSALLKALRSINL